jgi:hypothetical protein
MEFPEWDFILVKNNIFPFLHGEIGLVNYALDGFYYIIDDKIKILSNQEKTARNSSIIAEVGLEQSREQINNAWKQTQSVDLELYGILKKDITDSLKWQNLAEDERNNMVEEKKSVDDKIAAIKNEQKTIEADTKIKRGFKSSKKVLQRNWGENQVR